MKAESYFHIQADNQEEYDFLISLGLSYIPAQPGIFADLIACTIFLVTPKAMVRIFKLLKEVKV